MKYTRNRTENTSSPFGFTWQLEHRRSGDLCDPHKVEGMSTFDNYILDNNNGTKRPNSPVDQLTLDPPVWITREDEQTGRYWATRVFDFWGNPSYPQQIPGHNGTNVSALIADCTRDLAGHMDNGLLGLASIAEVGSLKKLGTGIVNVGRELVSVFGKGSTLKRIQHLVKADLGYRFTIKTLLTDIKSSINVNHQLNNHLRKLNQRSNRKEFSISKAATESDADITTTTRVTLRCAGKYELTDLTATMSLIDYFGISRFASTLWELVPLSFVVDYGINIGDFISGLEDHFRDKIHTQENVSCLSACMSKSSKIHMEYELSLLSDFTFSAFLTGKRYTRTPIGFSPSFVDSLRVSGFSANQLKTSGELFLIRL